MARRGERAEEEEANDRHHPYEEEEEERDEQRRISSRSEASSSGRGKRKQPPAMSRFIDYEAEVDEDEEEEEEEEGEDDFIDEGAELAGNEAEQRMPRGTFISDENEEDVEEMERRVRERYTRSSHLDYAEDANAVEQQSLLPSIFDPKLWLVKCEVGQERVLAIRLMQKCINMPELKITSAVALDHLKNYIYVEADREAHVKEACKGIRGIYLSIKMILCPTKEMPGVLCVENKVEGIVRDSWVRMRSGEYKGDLAQVVHVDYVTRRVTVKLIPRVDLQYLADKSAAHMRGVVLKKKPFLPPPRFFNEKEARSLKSLRVYYKRDRELGEDLVIVETASSSRLMFKDGFIYRMVSMSSVSTEHVHPTLEELENFSKRPDSGASGDIAADLSTVFANRKRGHFMKGDPVIVIRGDLKNLEGWVDRVDIDYVHIRPKLTGLPETLSFNEKDLCKLFENGEHVKVISGVQKGATGMVVKVDGHVLTVMSDATKEHISVFVDHVVQSTEISTGTLVGGSNTGNSGDAVDLRFGAPRPSSSSSGPQFRGGLPPRAPSSRFSGGRFGGGGGRGHGDNLVGKRIKIKSGPFKGYRGRVAGVKGTLVRVEQESQMKFISVTRDQVAEEADTTQSAPPPPRDARYSSPVPGTPIRPSRTPQVAAPRTPIHQGMRTPIRDYPPSPAQNSWDQANPAPLRSSPSYHQRTPPPARLYGTPSRDTSGGNFSSSSTTPRDTYANARVPSTPLRQPMDVRSRIGGVEGRLPVIRPKKSDKIRVIRGALDGLTGKLIGIDGSDGIVKLDGLMDVQIVKMDFLAKMD